MKTTTDQKKALEIGVEENMNAPEILYDDNHLNDVNKKPGDIVQGDKTGDKPMSEHLKDYVKDKFQKSGEWCRNFCTNE